MFPPPRPWKQRTSVDAEQEYVAFTSRFFLRSVLRAPAFMARTRSIMKQADRAPGIIGWSLGFDLFKLEFYTLSAWENAESLRGFVQDAGHRLALEEFGQDMRRKSIFVYYRVLGRDLPLTWKDALARQARQERHGAGPT